MDPVRLETFGELAPNMGALFDADNASTLISQKYVPEWSEFCSSVEQLEPTQKINYAADLVQVVGEVDVTQNDRDVAIALIVELVGSAAYQIDIGTTDAHPIINSYLSAIQQLPDNADPVGAPLSLIELGTSLCGKLGTSRDFLDHISTQERIVDTWQSKRHLISNEHDMKIQEISRTLLPEVPLYNETAWEWSRHRPELSGEAKTVHDAVVSSLEKVKRLKTFVAENSQSLQKTAQDNYNIDMKRYWNMRNPSDMDEKRSLLTSSLSQHQSKELSTRLEDKGVSLAKIVENSDYSRAVVDEFAETIDEMLLSQTTVKSANEQLTSLRQLATTVPEARHPAKRIKTIKKLLIQLELVTPDADWEATLATFELPSTQTLLTEMFTATTNRRIDQTRALEALRIPNPYDSLRMMGRSEYDLFSGDLTRDCTAYHMENGFNAWTVPYWLLDPGINLIYIMDGPKMIAKLGTLLTVDEQNQPRLVIDSIEASKSIPNARRALEVIEKGFYQLQSWADNLGLGDVFVCTFTNSQELGMNLPITENPNQPTSLVPLGHTETTDANDEVIGKILDIDDPCDWFSRVRPYLQSTLRNFNNEQDVANNPTEKEYFYANTLEKTINEAAKMLKNPANKDKLFEIARSGDWNKLFKAYLQIVLPRLHRAFTTDHDMWLQVHQAYRTQGWLDGHEHRLHSDEELSFGITSSITDIYIRLNPAGDLDTFDDLSDEQFNQWIEDMTKGIPKDFIQDIELLAGASNRDIIQNIDLVQELLNFEEEVIEGGYTMSRLMQIVYGQQPEDDEEDENERAYSIATSLPVIDRDYLNQILGTSL